MHHAAGFSRGRVFRRKSFMQNNLRLISWLWRYALYARYAYGWPGEGSASSRTAALPFFEFLKGRNAVHF